MSRIERPDARTGRPDGAGNPRQAPSLAIGIGCRSACLADVVVALVARVTAGLDCTGARLFTLDRKVETASLQEASRRLGLPLVGVSAAALRGVSGCVTVHSPRVLAATGAPSIAEAAALVGAGPGATLIVARTVLGGATCAVATAGRGEPDPNDATSPG